MNHNNWYDRVTGNATERAASLASGVTTSTLNRQLAKGVLSPENVIAISRAYGVNVVQGLVSTGYLKAEEASGLTEEQMADSLSDRVLIGTLAKRLGEDPDELMDEAQPDEASNVRQLPTSSVPEEWHDLAVADSSPDHEEEETDFG